MHNKKISRWMKSRWVKSVGILAAVFVVLGAAGCSADNADNADNKKAEDATELKTVRIGGITQGDYLTSVAGVAQKLGYLDEELKAAGYQADIYGFQSGPAVDEAFISDQLDVVVSVGDLPALIAKGQGSNSRAFIVNGNNQYAILGKNDAEFSSLKDLEGKKVGVSTGTVLQYFFESALESQGVDPSKVEYVNDISIATFLTGDVDYVALTNYMADSYEREGQGKIVYSTIEANDFWSQGIAYSGEEYIEENIEAIKAIIRAEERVQEYAKNTPEEFYEILSENTNGTFKPESYAAEYEGDDDFDALSPVIDDDAMENLQKVYQFGRDRELITNEIDIESWIYQIK